MSDHFSGPAVMGDPSVDITDFYCFPSPDRPASMVLIMNLFPLANEDARFSNAVTYRIRIRGAHARGADTKAGRGVTFVASEDEFVINFGFSSLSGDHSEQNGTCLIPSISEIAFTLGKMVESGPIRLFVGLCSDPFFMDVGAALRTEKQGRLAYTDPGINPLSSRDCLSMVVEIPTSTVLTALQKPSLLAAVAETLGQGGVKPLRIERVGRPEIKNFILANPARDPQATGVELRDLYNREDPFALSTEYRPSFEKRFDVNLQFFDGLDDEEAWPAMSGGAHPLRELLLADYLIMDPTFAFTPNGYLEIEKALLSDRTHTSAGGRWLNDNIVDEMLSLYVSGGKTRISDHVEGPTKLASLTFPYVREPSLDRDLPPLSL